MFLLYAVEDNIEKKTELNVVLNESLNTINKIYTVSKKCVLRVSIVLFFLRSLFYIEILPHKQG
jgi:hypothetical protein